MSVQSDIQMLSIRSMEVYASRNNLTTNEVNDIFHKHQIFEKIVLQHEYLHQVDFEEVMEFINKAITKESREMILFHGSVHAFDRIDLHKSHNRRDFGKGFYTTLLEQQAQEWAYRLSLREYVNNYFVYQYVFEENEVLKVKRFDALNTEWLEFIKENRIKGGLHHKYDVVIGPVADDNTMETVQLYLSDVLRAEEAVDRLRYNKVNNQVSFHTERSLEYLKFVERKQYE